MAGQQRNRHSATAASSRATGSAAVPQSGNPATQQTSGQDNPESASSKLFDLRWLIAAMFVVYGVILVVTGILDGKAEIAKASGVRINLWTGLGMFVVGVLFAVWARMRPLHKEDVS